MTRQGHWALFVAAIIAGAVIWMVIFPQYQDRGYGWVAGLFTVFLVLTVVYARGDHRRQR
jgi:hypothetical protein